MPKFYWFFTLTPHPAFFFHSLLCIFEQYPHLLSVNIHNPALSVFALWHVLLPQSTAKCEVYVQGRDWEFGIGFFFVSLHRSLPLPNFMRRKLHCLGSKLEIIAGKWRHFQQPAHPVALWPDRSQVGIGFFTKTSEIRIIKFFPGKKLNVIFFINVYNKIYEFNKFDIFDLFLLT